MKLYGYSERGLVNALCYDCVRNPNGESFLVKLLQEACFPLLDDKPSFAEIRHVTLFVEQSLSEFGHCDLIILCDTNDARQFAIFCEFKRGSHWSLKEEWERFTVRVENSIQENLTSNLFCQLYFKARFSSALLDDSLPEGVEFDKPLNTRGGDGRRRIGANQTVLRAVDMIRPYAKTSYFLMVTPQAMDQNEVASFAQQTNGWPGNLRGWSTRRWGHLSLSAIHNCCERHPEAFSHALEVFEFNQGQLY